MSRWVEVEVDFGDEETKNFGVRHESSQSNSLYQLQTLATISASKKHQNNNLPEPLPNPAIGGCTNGIFTAVSAGSDVSVFTLEPSINFLATFALRNVVGSMCFLGNSDVLVVGTAAGELTLFSVIHRKLLFSQMIFSGGSLQLKEVCCSVDPVSGIVLLFISTTGSSLVVINLPKVSQFETALNKFDQTMLKKLQSSVARVSLDFSDCHNCVSSFAPTTNGKIFVAGDGKYSLSMWELTENAFVCTQGAVVCEGRTIFKQIVVMSNGLYLVGLDTKGSLHIWDLWCFMELGVIPSDDCLVDFLLLESSSTGHGIDDYRLYLLRKNCQTECYTAEIHNLMDLSLVYSVAISSCSSLVKCPLSQDSLYLIEGVATEDTCSDVDQLRLRCITEAQPEIRLGRLLSRGKFRDAELLAVTFGLSTEVVFKTEANLLMFKLSQSDDEGSDFLELTNCLDHIRDAVAVVTVCCSAMFPNFQLTRRLITYAESRLRTELGSQGRNAELHKVSTRLFKYQFKMTTFQMCYGVDTFSLDAWERFNRSSPLALLKSFLMGGSLDEAMSIWDRCTDEVLDDMTESTVLEFLSVISDEIRSERLIPWFQSTVFPHLISSFATAVDLLASWVEQRARNMELTEAKEWPTNSLEFATVLPTVLDTIEGTPLCPTPAQMANIIHHTSMVLSSAYRPNSRLGQLNSLIEQLKQICRMHSTYKCRLSFSAFVAENRESLCYRILDRVQAIELISAGIEQFAKPYMKENSLPVDQTLFQYVQDIIQQSKKVSKNYGDSVWEARALAVVFCISQTDFKLRSVLSIVEKANFPWSADLVHLVDSFNNVNNPIVGEIEKTRKYVAIKMVLAKYNVNGSNVTRNLNAVDSIVRLILTKDTSESLQDALAVGLFFKRMSEVDIYLIQCRFLMGLGKVSDVLNTINRMTDIGQRWGCLRRLLLFCKMQADLHWEPTEVESLTKRFHILSSSKRLTTALLELNDQSSDEWESLSESLWTLACLQMEFGELLKLKELDDSTVSQNLLLKFVKGYQSGHSPETFKSPVRRLIHASKQMMSTQLTWSKILRLCDLLSIEHADLLDHLVITETESNAVDKSLEYCRELATRNTETAAEVVRNAVCRYANFIGNPPVTVDRSVLVELSHASTKLIAMAVSHCHSDYLQSYCQTSELTWLAADTVKQVAGHILSPSGTQLPSDYYKDVGLLLPMEKVLSTVYSVVGCIIQPQLGMESSVLRSVSGFLKGNGQVLWAIRWSLALGDLSRNENELKELLERLVERILLNSSDDLELLFAHVAYMSADRVFSFLFELKNKIGSNYKALTSLTHCATGAARLHGKDMLLDRLEKAKKAAHWSSELSPRNIDCQAIIEGTAEEKLLLVQQFYIIPNVTVDYLKRYCGDFQLDVSEAVMLLVESFLVHLTQSNCSSSGNEMMDSLKRFTDAAIPKRSRVAAANRLSEMLRRLDPYNYDGIEFVLSRLVLSEVSRYMEIFKFLRSYERFQEISPQEKQMYMEFSQGDSLFYYCGTVDMPAAAKKRLPFHPFVFSQFRCWEILKAELNLSNFEIWLSQSTRVQIQPEKILLQTITNVMPELSAMSQSDSSSLRGLQMLDRISHILCAFSNHQVAVMCASTLAKNLNSGKMRLAATRIMVKLTESRVAMGPVNSMKLDEEYESAKKALVKFRTICACFETEAILKEHNYDQPTFLELHQNPLKLIFALFDRFDAVCGWNHRELDNLKVTISQVCAAFQLDFSEVLALLKEKYLPFGSTNFGSFSEASRFMDRSQVNSPDLDSAVAEKQRVRKVFILLSYDQITQGTIANLVATIDNELTPVENRLIATKVLFAVCPSDKMELLAGTSVDQLKSRLRDLQYLKLLEQLKLPQSESAFANSNKEGLLKGLWAVAHKRSEGVEFVASLVQDFHIECGDILDELFRILNARELIPMAMSLSDYVKRTDSLWSFRK